MPNAPKGVLFNLHEIGSVHNKSNTKLTGNETQKISPTTTAQNFTFLHLGVHSYFHRNLKLVIVPEDTFILVAFVWLHIYTFLCFSPHRLKNRRPVELIVVT